MSPSLADTLFWISFISVAGFLCYSVHKTREYKELIDRILSRLPETKRRSFQAYGPFFDKLNIFRFEKYILKDQDAGNHVNQHDMDAVRLFSRFRIRAFLIVVLLWIPAILGFLLQTTI